MIFGGRLHAGPRQREILGLMARGQSDVQIALELGISVATVRTYLTRLYRDNGFHNRVEAVAEWVRSMPDARL
jgi:DNA-binding CsgD family transcriptional regulator